MSKVKQYGLWLVLVLTGLGFLGAGAAKLMGVPAVHQSFAILGLPVAFGYFIGVCEVAGAIGIFIKKVSALAALGLSVIMLGAMYYHLVYDPAHFAAAAILFVCSVVIFFANKSHSIVFAKPKLAS